MHRTARRKRMLPPILAGALAAALMLSAPAAQAQPTNPATLAAMADAEGRRSRALARIDAAIATLGADARQALEQRLARQMEEALRPVRAAVDAARAEIDRTVGFSDAFSAEERERKLRDALARAGIDAALDTLPRDIRERVAREIGVVHDRGSAQLNQVLREEFADPLGPRAGAVLLADLSDRLTRAARDRLGELPRPDAAAAPHLPTGPLAAGGAALIARRVVMGPAAGLIGRALGRSAAVFALSPGKATGAGIAIDAGIAALSLGAFVLESGDATRMAMRDALDAWFAAEVAAPLRDPAMTQLVARAGIAGVEEQLRRDRDAAAEVVARAYAGVFEQMRSPGFAGFAARAEEAALRQALFAVPSVFGAEFVELDYATKLELALRIVPTDLARLLVRRHGRAFVALFRAHPHETAAVASMTDAPRAFAHIVASADPEAELLLLSQAIDRLGALDGPQTAALILARRLAPAAPVGRLGADGLVRLAAVAGPLEAAAASRPAEAARLTEQVLDGSLPPPLLLRLLGRTGTPALLDLLDAIGSRRLEALLGIAPVDDIQRYLASVPEAPRLLLADGPGSLRFFDLPTGGGLRAVLARERVRQGAGGSLEAPAEASLHWLLARTDLPAESMDLGLVRNLSAFGIPGPLWPDGLAVPLAGIVARTGLIAPLLGLLLLAVVPVIGAWLRLWRRRGPRIAGAPRWPSIAMPSRKPAVPSLPPKTSG
jgi:F0F1-type ATP synthase membrane subunit b/b'